MVLGQVALQGAHHLALVLLLLHVDEVDDDDPAQVAEPQLAADGLYRLEVGLEDGLFQVVVPHETAGVDVDGGHRLGLVDDQVATRLQLHPPCQRLLDLVFHVV